MDASPRKETGERTTAAASRRGCGPWREWLSPTYWWMSLQLLWRKLHVLYVGFWVYRVYTAASKEGDKLSNPMEIALHWDQVHAKMAKYVCTHMVKLRGLWVKLGQFFGTRSDIMPDAWISELAGLQDQMPAQSWYRTRNTIQEAFGVPPERLFSHIEKEPLGTASIAQVHRAVLHSGEAVVVKVQHPHIRRVIGLDLQLAAFMAGKLKDRHPKYDITSVLQEWSSETIKEVDFIHEGENTERVRANLARDPSLGVHVPAVVRAPARPEAGLPAIRPTAAVLVLEFFRGVKPTDIAGMEAIGALDRVTGERILASITAAFAHQVFLDGLFNADPHPGNILILRDTHKPVLLDFGMTKEVSQQHRLAFARLLISAEESDVAGLLQALGDMGLPQADLGNPQQALETVHYMFRDAHPSAHHRQAAMTARAKAQAKAAQAARDARAQPGGAAVAGKKKMKRLGTPYARARPDAAMWSQNPLGPHSASTATEAGWGGDSSSAGGEGAPDSREGQARDPEGDSQSPPSSPCPSLTAPPIVSASRAAVDAGIGAAPPSPRAHPSLSVESAPEPHMGVGSPSLPSSIASPPPPLIKTAVHGPQHDEEPRPPVPQEEGPEESQYSVATGKRYPLQATPGSILFLLRVVGCLRGMATTLGLSHSYITYMAPFARQAIRSAHLPAHLPATTSSTSACLPDASLPTPPQASSEEEPAPVAPVAGAEAPRGPLCRQPGGPHALHGPLRALMDDLLRTDKALGIQVCVYERGQVVFNEGCGELGPTDPRPVTAHSLFCAFSCSKALCALLAHQLLDRGWIASADDLVEEYWEGYGQAGTTVRMVLEHRAGMSTAMPPAADIPLLCDWPAMVEWMRTATPTEAVGGAASYHALTYGWLVGGLLEHAANAFTTRTSAPVTYQQLVEKLVCGPLALEGELLVQLPPEGSPEAARQRLEERLAHVALDGPAKEALFGGGGDIFTRLSGAQQQAPPSSTAADQGDAPMEMGGLSAMPLDPRAFNDRKLRQSLLPAANTHMTAYGLASIFAALAGDGSVGGRQLLSKAYSEQLQAHIAAASSDFPLGFRRMEFKNSKGGVQGVGFGYAGLGQMLGFCHPESGVGAAILVNRLGTRAVATNAVMKLLDDHLGLGSYQLG